MQLLSTMWLGLTARQVRRMTFAYLLATALSISLFIWLYDIATGSPGNPGATARLAVGFAIGLSVPVWFQLRRHGVLLSAAGIDLDRGWRNRHFVPWSQVRSIRTGRRPFGRTVLVIDIGRDVLVPAPFACSSLGGWFDDPEFASKVDHEGRPVLGLDDWVDVFDGSGPDVTNVRQALDDEGIESKTHVYVPLGSAFGRAADPRATISVPAPAADRANAVLDQLPHLGSRFTDG